jgi:predicted RNA-binding Zn-ribbon protein involved in translation (DUF1610 family)
MSRINEKMGLKPQTRRRAATHASAIASDKCCPTCGSQHVLRCQAKNATTDYMCANGHFFNEEPREG